MSSKTMIALKDIGEIIKKDAEVTVLHLHKGYIFVESIKDGKNVWKDQIDSTDLYKLFRDLTEEENHVGYCGSCESEIVRGEEFLKGCEEDDDIYCRGCVKEYTVTSFSLDGERIGTDDDGWGFETK